MNVYNFLRSIHNLKPYFDIRQDGLIENKTSKTLSLTGTINIWEYFPFYHDISISTSSGL